MTLVCSARRVLGLGGRSLQRTVRTVNVFNFRSQVQLLAPCTRRRQPRSDPTPGGRRRVQGANNCTLERKLKKITVRTVRCNDLPPNPSTRRALQTNGIVPPVQSIILADWEWFSGTCRTVGL